MKSSCDFAKLWGDVSCLAAAACMFLALGACAPHADPKSLQGERLGAPDRPAVTKPPTQTSLPSYFGDEYAEVQRALPVPSSESSAPTF